MSRTIFIGDVHGCARELYKLIDQLEVSEKDNIYFLGDIINRGPDSHEAVKIVRKLPNTRSLLGNHELRLLNYWKSKDTSILKHYDISTIRQLSENDKQYIKQMDKPLLLPDINTIIAHAGFLPDIPWNEQSLGITTFIQSIDDKGKPVKLKHVPDSTPWYKRWHAKNRVIYGHWPRYNVHEENNTIGIDTGCVYGGMLTAYILPDNEFVQVKASKKYI